MDKKKVFMIGMPSSGKTTYLASLCRLLLHEEAGIKWKLDKKDIPDGFENIGKMITNLNSYQEVGRTQDGDFYKISLNLYNQSQEWMQFVVPDLSGEIFRDLVYDRRIPLNLIEQIANSDMLLFFINFNTMVPEERIKLNEKTAIKKLNEGQVNADIKCSATVEKKSKKYNDQSALVELFQSIIYLVPHSLNVRCVISAWDIVEKEFKADKLTPEDYIKIKLPLLYQCLVSNSKTVNYDIWGVSAQGGDFGDMDDLKRLQSLNDNDGVYVVDSKADISIDLTRLL